MTFRLAPHSIRPDTQVVEIWDGGQFVAQIVPGQEPGELRVISKHRLLVETIGPGVGSPGVLQVRIVVA